MYFGSDGNSPVSPCSGEGLFYIGKMGENLTVCTSSGCGGYVMAFDTSTAQTVNNGGGRTYGYWALHGPNDPAAANYSTPYAYGQAQGSNAISGKQAWASYVNGLTVFADVEQPGSLGWGTNYTANQQVINGFLDTVHGYYGTVGLYSSPCAWQGIAGAVGWVPNDSPVEWTSELNYATDPGCAAIQSGWGYYYNAACGSSYQGAQGFASIVPTLWQYTTNGGGKGYDWDVASSLPS